MKISNKGFEITLGITPITAKDFYWKADISLAHNKAKIDKKIVTENSVTI